MILPLPKAPGGTITQIRTRKGTSTTVAQLAADPENESGPVDVAVNGLGNTYAVMSGPFAQLVRIHPNGNTEIVADIGAYQVTDPDPTAVAIGPDGA